MPDQSSPLRVLGVLRRSLPFSAPMLVAIACGDSEEKTPPRPPGPIAIAIEELRPRGVDVWRRGDPEPVVVGCDRRVAVTVDLYDPDALAGGGATAERSPGDWLLRPPGACGGRKQCGTVGVSVSPLAGGPVATGEASLKTVLVDLAPLGETLDGRVRIRAELLDDGQTPAMKGEELLADEIEVELTPERCGTGGGSGTGGAGGVGPGGVGGMAGAGQAGAPVTGGTGGTGGTSSGAGGEGGASGGKGGRGKG